MDDEFEMYDESDVSNNSGASSNTQSVNQYTVDYNSNNSYQQYNSDYNIQGYGNNNLNSDVFNNNISTPNYSNPESSVFNVQSDFDSDMIDESEISSMSVDNSSNEAVTNNYQQYNSNYNMNYTDPSVLAPMYSEDSSTSYEEELKTVTPKVETPVQVIEEKPAEITYSDDFMDYDPMLHNDLETDGNYVITQFDPNEKSDYVPEKTNFDSEEVMEYYQEENVEKEVPKAEVEKEEPETFNTVGMMQYDTNNVDTFSDGATSSGTVVTRFIFDEMSNSSEEKPTEELSNHRTVGAIPIYDKQRGLEGEENSSRKTLELVAVFVFFALLILLVSFFPDINKIFDNFKN